MRLTISLSWGLRDRIYAHAHALGLAPGAYLCRLAEKDLEKQTQRHNERNDMTDETSTQTPAAPAVIKRRLQLDEYRQAIQRLGDKPWIAKELAAEAGVEIRAAYNAIYKLSRAGEIVKAGGRRDGWKCPAKA